MNKKFNSLLIIRKSSSEIDYIIPVLNELKSKVNFYTLFLNENSFLSLKNSKFLYKEWKKTTKNFYIQKKTDRIFFKILRKLFGKFSNSLNNYFTNKIHDISYLKSKIKFGNSNKFHFILNEFQKTSHWANSLITNDPKTKLFLFPHTTHIYMYKEKILKKLQKRNELKYCDAVFLGCKQDIKLWKNKIDEDKIFITGHPKYDKNWQSKFKEKNLNNKKKIIFSIKNIIDQSSKKLTAKYLENLYKICRKNNFFLIVKLPPFPQTEINSIIKVFKKKADQKYYKIYNNNIFNILSNSSLNINFNQSATTLDALSFDVPTIQLPAVSKIKNKFGSNKSIYVDLKLAYPVSNYKDLDKIIKKFLYNTTKHRINSKLKFERFFPKKKDTAKKISNIIMKKIK